MPSPEELLRQAEVDQRVFQALQLGPRDRLSRWTGTATSLLTTVVATVLIPLRLITTLAAGVVGMLPPVRFAFGAIVTGASWLLVRLSQAWVRWPVTRPFVLLPGLALALVAAALLPLLGESTEPTRNRGIWRLRLFANDWWPYTWVIWDQERALGLESAIRLTFLPVGDGTPSRDF